MADIIISGAKKDPFRVIVSIVTITTDEQGNEIQKQSIAVEEGSPDAATNAMKVWVLEDKVYPAAKAALAELAGAAGVGPSDKPKGK